MGVDTVPLLVVGGLEGISNLGPEQLDCLAKKRNRGVYLNVAFMHRDHVPDLDVARSPVDCTDAAWLCLIIATDSNMQAARTFIVVECQRVQCGIRSLAECEVDP